MYLQCNPSCETKHAINQPTNQPVVINLGSIL